MRRLGLSVDILRPDTTDLSGYRVIALPGMMHVPADLADRLAESGAALLCGPRTAARDVNFRIPVPLPPRLPGAEMTVSYVESLRPEAGVKLRGGGKLHSYREHIEAHTKVLIEAEDGGPVVLRSGPWTYVAAVLDDTGWQRVVSTICAEAGVATVEMPEGVRTRATATERFWFNHCDYAQSFRGMTLPPAGVLRETLRG